MQTKETINSFYTDQISFYSLKFPSHLGVLGFWGAQLEQLLSVRALFAERPAGR